jgi:predicted unusual protein kinase regulating ubiquinone biosynthesis (AarF/ABC1/UbiB family)
VGARFQRTRRALEVARTARRSRLFTVLREIGVVGERPATREGAVEFRQALEELGTTYLKLGQLLSSRPDLLPDVYIEELSKLVDEVPPFPFAEVEQIVQEDIGDGRTAASRCSTSASSAGWTAPWRTASARRSSSSGC